MKGERRRAPSECPIAGDQLSRSRRRWASAAAAAGAAEERHTPADLAAGEGALSIEPAQGHRREPVGRWDATAYGDTSARLPQPAASLDTGAIDR